MIFAANVSRAIFRLAQWRLERGERLGVLDQVFGSTTIVSSVTTQLETGAFNVVGLLMILIWALSPIGGQSSARILEFQTGTTSLFAYTVYLDMNNTFNEYTGAVDAVPAAAAHGVFVAALLTPGNVQSSSQDTWGNVKVPMLESL
jgi:hypothetical protein